MVGLGETYLPAFALAVGLGELVAGLVASVPLLAGGVLQTVSPWGIRRLGSHKRWVVLCATVQSLTFLPLLLSRVAWGDHGWGPACDRHAVLGGRAGHRSGLEHVDRDGRASCDPNAVLRAPHTRLAGGGVRRFLAGRARPAGRFPI